MLLTRSNLLSWQQIADHDIIFVGLPKFNRQLQAAALTQDIVVEPYGIRNLKPRAGEPAYLEDHIVPGKPSEGETHALISRIPGPSGVGEFLIIAGNASPRYAGGGRVADPAVAREGADRAAAHGVGGDPAVFSGGDQGGVQAGDPGHEFLRVSPRVIT
jgi:hypothetical protein